MKRSTHIITLALVISFCCGQIIKMPLTYHKEETSIFSNLGNMRNLKSYSSQGITNFNRNQYYGTIYLGLNQQSFKVLFDTSSSYSWIPNKSCVQNNNCHLFSGFNNTYTCTIEDRCASLLEQDTYYYPNNGRIEGRYINASLSIAGLNGTPTMMLSANTVSQMNYLFVDGVLSLSMYNTQNYKSNSYVEQLYNIGQINERMFSFYLGFKFGDSQVTFGGYDSSKIKDNATISYHNVIPNADKGSQQWVVQSNKIQIGNYEKVLNQGQNVASISTFNSYISFSQDIFDEIISYLTKNNNVYKSDSNYYVKCDQQMPDLNITLPDSNKVEQIYTISPDYYVRNSTFSCMLEFGSFSKDNTYQIILGTTFLRKYVSIFSLKNSTIGFAQSIADPDDDYTKLAVWVYVVIALAAVAAVIAGGVYLFKRWKQKKNQEKLNNQSNDNQGYQPPAYQNEQPIHSGSIQQYQQYPPQINNN